MLAGALARKVTASLDDVFATSAPENAGHQGSGKAWLLLAFAMRALMRYMII
jgi:hypothetical protein